MDIKKLCKDYLEFKEQEVEIQGWVRNHRIGKNVSFLMVNDGSDFETLQVIYKELENLEEIQKVNVAAAVRVRGVLKVLEGKKQDFEIEAKTIEVLGASDEKYPLQPKKHSYEFLREIAHLRPRSNTFYSVFKVRSLLAQYLHEFFTSEDFVYLNSPIITGADAEGAGEMFRVTNFDLNNLPMAEGKVNDREDFFSKDAYLTVSGQLLAESYALAFGKVYTFGPTFRAENSNTTRHAAEFWMLEPEVAFADLKDIIDLAENMLKYVVGKILQNAPKELEFLNGLVDYDLIERLKSLVDSKFNQVTYTKAIEILNKAIENGKKFENDVFWGVDLATEHERYLTDEYFKAPIFVTDYPKEIKAFYMRRNSDEKTVAATDLLVPGIGELIGGSQREERFDVLNTIMDELQMDKEELKWYLDLRRYGGVYHSGFGIGFERLIMYVTGIENIRDVIPFPRTPRNLEY